MTSRRQKGYFLIFSAYIIWALFFLSKTSFEIEGTRYYALFDDAMISMRYAWNFVQGHGLVWNVNDVPVEGYTNFLWVMVMALQISFFGRFNGILAVQAVGLILLCINAFLSVNLLRFIRNKLQWRENLLHEYLFLIFMLLYYPSNYWGLLGMETSLITFLGLVAINFVLRKGPSHLPLLGIILGLSFLTRPDTILMSALIIFYRIYGLGFNRWRLWLFDIVVLIFMIGMLSLFRVAYYGSIVPNTYILKVDGIPLMARIADGLRFVTPYLLTSSVLFALAIWALIQLKRSRISTAITGTKELTLLGTVVLAYVAYQVWTGGDPWPYWRMFVSTTPMLLILAFVGLERFLNYLRYHRMRLVASWAVFFLALASSLQPFFAQVILVESPLHVSEHERLIQRAFLLNDVLYPNARIAVIWAGILPYYTDFYAIDMLGKNDSVIAKLPPDLSGEISWWGLHSVPGHNKYDLNYSINILRATYADQVEYASSKPEAPQMIEVNIDYRRFFLDLSSPYVNMERLQDYINAARK